MLKGIDLQAKLHIGADSAAQSELKEKLPELFAQTNPGLKLRIKKVSEPDSAGDVTLRVYIEGEQDPAADFAALTRGALEKSVAAYNSGGGAAAGHATSAAAAMAAVSAGQPALHLKDLKEMEGDEEDTDVTLAPQVASQAASTAPSTLSTPSLAPADAAATSPPLAPPPAPPQQPASAPSAEASSSPPPTQATTQAAVRPWWAFWRRTN